MHLDGWGLALQIRRLSEPLTSRESYARGGPRVIDEYRTLQITSVGLSIISSRQGRQDTGYIYDGQSHTLIAPRHLFPHAVR